MPKRLDSWEKIEIISFVKIVGIGFLFSILLANCNNKDKERKVDWLVHWKDIQLESDPNDRPKVDSEMSNIRIWVRGWLAEFVDTARKSYEVKEFVFDTISRSPLTFKVHAFLKPSAIARVEHEGESEEHPAGDVPMGHLYPPPPPPPPK